MLNFVINPSSRFDLPFFGADLVTLPNGHLLALDLQPVDKTDPDHTEPVWQRLMPLFERWRTELPDGGPSLTRPSRISHLPFSGPGSRLGKKVMH